MPPTASAPPRPSACRRPALWALLALALVGCGAFPVPSAPAPTLWHVTTSDGWQIALHRLDPPPGAPARRAPVIVCHGIASNRYNLDITPSASLPRGLAQAGYTVHMLELRGGGESEQPGWFSDHQWTYSFDDYVLQDLPAAIEAVAAQSPSGQVHWVGHSMGGMVLYGYLQRVGNGRIRSATALGSPPYAPTHLASLRAVAALWPLARALFTRAPSGSLGALGAPVAAPARDPLLHVLWNPDNLAPAVARRLAAHATEDISTVAVGQLVDSGPARRLRSADGRWDYTANLARITAPLLLVAGAADALGRPALLMQVYDAIASADRQVRVFARAHGDRHDYGHLDLVVGDAAAAEVFPVVARWIDAHD